MLELDSDKFVVRHVLGGNPASVEVVESGKTKNLQAVGITHYHYLPDRGHASIDTITATDGDAVLISIPSNVSMLSTPEATISEKCQAVGEALHKQGLTHGFDYEILYTTRTVAPKFQSPKDRPISPDEDMEITLPGSVIVRMDAYAYHDLARKMLEKIANPETGKALLGGQFVDDHDYCRRFGVKGSVLQTSVTNILANARFGGMQRKRLKDLANKHENYELARLIMGPVQGKHTAREADRTVTEQAGPDTITI